MSDGFANITVIIMIYFEIGLPSPKPEAMAYTQGPACAETLGISAALTAVCWRLCPCPDPYQQNAQLTDPRRSSYYRVLFRWELLIQPDWELGLFFLDRTDRQIDRSLEAQP